MPKIKFSHKYEKLYDMVTKNIVGKGTLLEVFDAKTEDLDKEFIQYDTEYIDKNGNLKQYPLPNGDVLVLLFYVVLLDNRDMMFTTIRSAWRESKREYYRSKRGEVFDVVIEEKEK